MGRTDVEKESAFYTVGISAAFIIGSSLVIEFIRRGSQHVVRDKEALKVILEMLATAELCANCFELNVVYRNHGLYACTLGLLFCTTWWKYHWQGADSGPIGSIVAWLEGTGSLTEILITTLAQFSSGYFVWFCVMKPFWWLELMQAHATIFTPHFCYLNFKVHYLVAAAIELIGVFVCDMAMKILKGRDTPYYKIIDAVICVAAVYMAFETSGGYYNPVQGTVFLYGCKGSTPFDIIVVYWVGAIIGGILASLVINLDPINSFLVGSSRSQFQLHAHSE